MDQPPPGFEYLLEQTGVNTKSTATDSDRKLGQIPARFASPELTDGQLSVALDSDLLSLIDNITQELSRTSTTATARTLTSASDRGSLFMGAFESKTHSNEAPQPWVKSGSFGYNFPRAVRSTSTNHSKGDPQAWATHLSSDPIQEDKVSVVSPLFLSPLSVSRTTTEGDVEPLPQVLHALDDKDDRCIVVVRRITRLGFKSNRIIKNCFEKLGWGVENVVLLPSRSRPVGPGHVPVPNASPHARPSSMGFVVFSNPASSAQALAMGSVNIDGVDVLIQPFVRQYKPSVNIDVRQTS